MSVQSFRKLEKWSVKYAKLKLDLLYLENCLELNICPKFLRVKLPKLDGIKGTKVSNEKIVKLKINEVNKDIRTTTRNLQKSKDLIRNNLSWLKWITLNSLIKKHVEKVLISVKECHEKKLLKLWIDQRIRAPEAVKNLSKHKLTPCELEALRFGLKHHILPKNLHLSKFKLSIEKGFFIASKEQHINHTTKDKVKHACTSFMNSADSICNSSRNTKLHETLRKLSSNSKIKVTSFDKGNGIVILDSDDYFAKLDEIISDSSKFEEFKWENEKFTDNPVVKNENKLTYFLTKYVKPYIPKDVFDRISPTGSQPGKLYGMSKIHKTGCPLRPVVSMINTAEYNLAKYLDDYIKPNIPMDFMLTSSTEFLNVLDGHKNKLSDNDIMISFDIVSLFTSLPLKESCDLATEYVYSENSTKKPPYSKETFRKLLDFATSGVFTYRNKYFKQCDGVMMGSPLGPTLSNLFLAHLEKEWFSKVYSPVLYKRYVDDIFCVFKDEDSALQFFEFLNKQHKNLKFTYEKSKNNNLPFLDINVIMKDETFETEIFRKKTFTGLVLNYKAMCPEQWKKGLIIGALHRGYSACSSWTSFHCEIEKLKNIFTSNGYPLEFINKIVHDFLNKKFISKNEEVKDERPKITFKIPYIGLPSLQLKRKLKKIFKDINIDINIVFSSTKVASYFSLKDRSDAILRSSLVYKFNCLDDPNNTYIGKTKRYLVKRIMEHKSQGSAIFAHLQKCKKCADSDLFKCFKVLDKANSDFDLQILEAINIKEKSPTLNKQLVKEGSFFLLNIF